jgi:predicted permease
VNEEMALHLELRTKQLVAEGWEPAAAAEEARRRFAAEKRDLEELYHSARERSARLQLRERLESWSQDIRYGARSLQRDPPLTVFVVLTLALGLGANVTAFGLVDRLLLRPPAGVTDWSRVVRLYGTVEDQTGTHTSSWIPFRIYEATKESASTLSSIAAFRQTQVRLGRGENAQRARAVTSLGSVFQTMGTRPLAGRFFTPQEDAASVGPLAVLSESLWRTRYGAAASAIGGTIEVDGTLHTIVGVSPGQFSGGEARRVDVWLLGNTRDANTMNWNVVGRMRPGVTHAQVRGEAQTVLAQNKESLPGGFQWFADAQLTVGTLRTSETGNAAVETTLATWFATVTGAILLAALANVVNLLLVRLARRRQELSVRMALGSGHARLFRLLGVEGALLALAGTALSLLIAASAEPILRRTIFEDAAGWSFRLLDARFLAIVLSFGLLAVLCVAVVPLRLVRPELMSVLRSGAPGSAHGNRGVRASLTVVQAVLSVVLLVGAGLFLRSIQRVNAVDFGVDRDRVLTAAAEFPRVPPAEIFEDFPGYLARERLDYERLAEGARALPWVEEASVAVGLPLDGGSFSTGVHVPGRDSVPSLPGGGPYASVVDAAYFRTAGTAVRRGRVFTEQDREGSELVLVINEAMARALWPNEEAVGKCVRVGDAGSPCRRVVGVVADVRRVGLREKPSMQLYLPHGQQHMFGGPTLLVRTKPGTSADFDELKRAVLAADGSVLVVDVKHISDAIGGETRPLRLGMVTFGLSGAIALLVAVMGLYSLTSSLVASRTREIGIRAAIGADRSSIARLVIGSGATLAATGIAIGLIIALLAGRLIETHLFETRAADPVVLGGVAALLLLVSLVAGWMPARRALRIDPTDALRAE